MESFSSFSVEQLISFGKKTAIATFLVGTLILGIYYLYNNNTIIYFSLFFILTAFVANAYFFIQLLTCLINKNTVKNKIRTTLLLMLLNIPVGFIYFEIGFYIYSSTMTN